MYTKLFLFLSYGLFRCESLRRRSLNVQVHSSVAQLASIYKFLEGVSSRCWGCKRRRAREILVAQLNMTQSSWTWDWDAKPRQMSGRKGNHGMAMAYNSPVLSLSLTLALDIMLEQCCPNFAFGFNALTEIWRYVSLWILLRFACYRS